MADTAKKFCVFFCLLTEVSCSGLSGSVRVVDDSILISKVQVALFRLDPKTESGLSKRRLLGAESEQPLRRPPADFIVETVRGIHANDTSTWSFESVDLPPGKYVAVAFEPAGVAFGNWLNFAPPRRQALGFYQNVDGCAPGDGQVCSTVLSVSLAANVTGIEIVLRAAHLMPSDRHVHNGALTAAPGFPAKVVNLQGNAYERGFAHGLLLSQQIIDFVDLFLIEDQVRSKHLYSGRFLPALKRHAQLTPRFREEVNGLIAGMRASGHSIKIALGRDIDFYDIVALNSYGESAAWTASEAAVPPTSNGACTQFVFWGDAVSPELLGGTIAGRNMDGENDVHKLTVNNLVIFAIYPSENELQKYVHVMWPGFVGASSGFNEHGRYLMENLGCNPPGPPAVKSPLTRDVLSSMLLNASIGPHASPERVEAGILAYRSDAGGSCPGGCIWVSAEPFQAGQEHPAGFVYEGDRNGGFTRLPAEVPPIVSQGIMATNHYFLYNAIPSHPERCNGQASSFSSLARYFAGQNKVESWIRRKSRIGSQDMKELLQTVAHGTTEHSVIFKPNTMTFEVAVASPNGVWDAPYLTWAKFSFDQVFDGITQTLFLRI